MQKTVQISEEELVAELRKWKETDINILKFLVKEKIRRNKADEMAKKQRALREKQEKYDNRFSKILRKTGVAHYQGYYYVSSPTDVRKRIKQVKDEIVSLEKQCKVLSKAIPKLNEWLKHNRKL
jgi:uncharacterized coiled-coil DUF342 family protein